MMDDNRAWENARMLLCEGLALDIPTPPLTPRDIAHIRDRLEQAVERFGEERTLAGLRAVPGLGWITLEIARTLLDTNEAD